MGRLAFFGGTFDPPHLGHLILAAEAQAQLGLEQVHFVLTADPPHKRGRKISPVTQRLALLQAALKDQPIFAVSRVEIDRPGPHFTVDTMKLLRKQFPRKELVYLVGGDSLRDLPQWDRPAEFLRSIDALGVMRRPGSRIDLKSLEKKLPGLSKKVEFIDAPLLEISASEIRQRIKVGGHYQYFLPPAVFKLIQNKKLYR
jgi:nicotinate-nucleotide adenylyltransferase